MSHLKAVTKISHMETTKWRYQRRHNVHGPVGFVRNILFRMELFATNLRKRAEELGISNAEAARRVGLSERRYGNYVSGRREPDLATLVRIAAVLETSPNRLLSFAASQEETGEVVEPGPEDRIRSAINVLPAPQLETVAVMVEALAAANGARR